MCVAEKQMPVNFKPGKKTLLCYKNSFTFITAINPAGKKGFINRETPYQ